MNSEAIHPAQDPRLTSSARRTARPLLLMFAKRAAVMALVLGFPLYEWGVLSWNHEVQSYLLLIPVISIYLAWQEKDRIPWAPGRFRGVSGAWAAAAFASLVFYIASRFAHFPLHAADSPTFGALSIACSMIALASACFSEQTFRHLRFPLMFLFMMVPLPTAALNGVETGLQHASAEAASWLFSLTGLSYLKDGLVFQLPGIQIMVAQECSGVRSTLVLFVTSIVAGHLFLEKPAHRALFTMLTIVIGVLRNGFRITVIAWLCVEIGPHMIHSIIHKRGGPVFFAIALVPTVLALFLLRRREKRSGPGPAGGRPAPLPSQNAPVPGAGIFPPA